MQKGLKKLCVTALAVACFAPLSIFAQDEKAGDEKDKKEKKEVEQITIIRKGDNKDKLVIEVTGEKITVNGKDIKDIKDDELQVNRHRIKDVYNFDNKAFGHGRNVYLSGMDENRAMLGVITDKDEEGAVIRSITKESAAEKAGLKEGDVITKIGDKKIEEPDDLSNAIRGQKAGDKVTVTYIRDKKENKATAELTKWKGSSVFSMGDNLNFNFDMPNVDMDMIMPTLPRAPRAYSRGFNWDASPKLGLSVQDAEDGKGVTVLEVEEDGNAAKAGIEEGDVITDVDGTAVNSADEIARAMKANKAKASVKVKLLRKGKSETIEVKMPKKLKTADL